MLCGPLSAQISVFECTPENSHVTQQELTGNQVEIYKPCLIFDAPQYNVSGGHIKDLHAIHTIEMTSTFHSKPTGLGSLHFQVGNKSGFDVVCMNYPDMTGMQKFEKLEFGVTMPEGVRQKVENFISKAPVSNEERLNPYMDWDIRVSLELSHPQMPYTFSVDGFYNKEYESWMVEDIPSTVPEGKYLDNYEGNNFNGFWNEQGGYNETPTDYPFLVRFAPPKIGTWNCRVHIFLPGESYSSDPFTFKVVDSPNPGYVWVGDESRYFQLGGHSFYPIGANIRWPMTLDVENNPGYDDPELQELLKYTYTDPETNEEKTVVLAEEYRQLRPLPQVFDNYREQIGNIADAGGNFVRLIMNPVSLDIEYETAGDYTERLYMAQELDEVLEYCENRKVYIDWNLLAHYVLMPVNEGGYTKAWNKKNEYQQHDYCYKHLEGVENPIDFFTNTYAKAYYKQRLRYILARWGYSTNIALFELLSEINTNEIFTNNPHLEPTAAHYELIEDWQEEMTTFIKERYHGATHMLAPSYAGLKMKNDDTFKDPRIEVMSTNVYPGLKTYAKNWIDQVQKEYLNQTFSAALAERSYTAWVDENNVPHTIHKPFLMSEFDPVDEYCDPLQVEMRRAMWQNVFSGAAGAVSWHANLNGINFQEYQRIRNFTSQFDLDDGGWHPGAMEVVNNLWIYHPEWADDMDKYRKGNNNQTNKADLMYLRSKDKTQAIGVITNKTYNIYSVYDNSCVKVLWDSLSRDATPEGIRINPPFPREPVNINKVPSEVDLALNGMKNGRYRIRYYRPDRLWQAEDESVNNGPKVEIEYRLDDNPENYIILFHAVFDPHFNMEPAEDSITGRDAEAIYFENLQKTGLSNVKNEVAGQALEFAVYPVPATEVLEISRNAFDGVIEVEILSAEGKLLKSFEMNSNHQQIDISQFEKGIYLLRFKVPGQENRQHKFMKL